METQTYVNSCAANTAPTTEINSVVTQNVKTNYGIPNPTFLQGSLSINEVIYSSLMYAIGGNAINYLLNPTSVDYNSV